MAIVGSVALSAIAHNRLVANAVAGRGVGT